MSGDQSACDAETLCDRDGLVVHVSRHLRNTLHVRGESGFFSHYLVIPLSKSVVDPRSLFFCRRVCIETCTRMSGSTWDRPGGPSGSPNRSTGSTVTPFLYPVPWTHIVTLLLPGFLTCLSLFAEDKKRRVELALYVLPKAMDSFWSIGRRKGYIPRIPQGDLVLASSGLAMVMGCYRNQPDKLSGLVRSLLYQFTGYEFSDIVSCFC
jgi:hypothetical protein